MIDRITKVFFVIPLIALLTMVSLNSVQAVSSSDAVYFKDLLTVDGVSGNVVNLAPSSVYELSQGTVVATFNTANISTRQGIVSKDGSNYGQGGHFVAYVDGGKLYIRFQDTDSEVKYSASVSVNTDHTFLASFGPDGVKAYLDGVLIGSNSSYDADWQNNAEYLQIGGLGWASVGGADAFSNPFKGTLSDVGIYPSVLVPSDFDSSSTPEPDPAPTPIPTPESEPDPTPEPEPESAGDGVYRSGTDLGWRAGEDIKDKLRNFLDNTAEAGDTLILEHFYTLSGTSPYTLPHNFTLSAVTGGGFDISDTDNVNSYVVELTSGNVLDNLTVTHSNTPNTGYSGNNPARHVDYHSRKIFSVSGNDVTVQNVHMTGFPSLYLDVRGDRLSVLNSHFEGSNTHIRFVAGVDGFIVNETVFSDALIDGIKTIIGSDGVTNPVVTNSVFERGRDGIDTTGGWKDGLIKNVIFRDNSVAGVDIKNGREYLRVEPDDNYNQNIRIEDSIFINSPNAVVTTLGPDDTNLLTINNTDYWAPHHIYLENVEIHQTKDRDPCCQAFLLKNGHNIYWNNVDMYGVGSEVRIMNQSSPSGWTMHSIVGTNVTKNDAVYQTIPTNYPFSFGPGATTSNVPEVSDSTPTPTPTSEPEPTSEPISVPDPEPEVTEVVVDSPVNVREEPSITAPIVDEKESGDTGEVIEGIPEVVADGYQWVPVDFDTGSDGWVVKKNITTTKRSGGGGGSSARKSSSVTTSSSDAVESTDTSSGQLSVSERIRTTSNLNVRVSPGGSLIRMVAHGTRGTKVDGAPVMQGGYSWIKVSFDDGTQGYVADAYTVTELTTQTVALSAERRNEILKQVQVLLQQVLLLQARLAELQGS